MTSYMLSFQAMSCWARPQPSVCADETERGNAEMSAQRVAYLRFLHLLWLASPGCLHNNDLPWSDELWNICGGAAGLEGMTSARMAERLLIGMRAQSLGGTQVSATRTEGRA